MGIQLHGINLIDKVLSLVAKRNTNTEIQIIDWGNSYIKPSAIKWIKEKNPQFSELEKNKQIRMPESHTEAWVAGDFFKALGCLYSSIDLNGKENSLQVDLREDITHYPTLKGTQELSELINVADVIIDCGTSEHVDNQYHNFKNQFNILKEGGLVLNILPKKGHWEFHCKYKYTVNFFEKLSKLCNYKMIFLAESNIEKYEEVEKGEGDDKKIMTRQDICCIIEKTPDSRFPTKEEFSKLPIHVEEGQAFNDRALYTYAYSKEQIEELAYFVKSKGGEYKGLRVIEGEEVEEQKTSQIKETYK